MHKTVCTLLSLLLALSPLSVGAFADEETVEPVEAAETETDPGLAWESEELSLDSLEETAAIDLANEPASENVDKEDTVLKTDQESVEPVAAGDEAMEDVLPTEEVEIPEDTEDIPQLDGVSVTFTEGDYTYTIEGVDATIKSYNGQDASVTLPTSVDYDGMDYKVRTIGYSAFADNMALQSVVIPYGISHIKSDAFKNCVNLSSITFNGDITDCSQYGTFQNTGTDCASLTVVFGENVTYIPAYLFYTDSSRVNNEYAHVTKVVFSDTVSTIGGHAFQNCYDLSEITWGSGLRSIKYCAFYNCTSIYQLDLPDNLKTIEEDVFDYCSSLVTLELPASLRELGRAFQYCTDLRTIIIKGDIEDSTYGGLFTRAGEYSSSLEVIFTEGVTYIPARLFYVSSSQVEHKYAHVSRVVIPSSVTKIQEYAFYNCYDLSDVVYNGTSEDWEKISIGKGNSFLTEARFTYEEPESPTITIVPNGRTAKVTGDITGLYARVALIINNNGTSGLCVLQCMVNPDGSIVIPTFFLPGITVTGVCVALVKTLDDVSSSKPDAIAISFAEF